MAGALCHLYLETSNTIVVTLTFWVSRLPGYKYDTPRAFRDPFPMSLYGCPILPSIATRTVKDSHSRVEIRPFKGRGSLRSHLQPRGMHCRRSHIIMLIGSATLVALYAWFIAVRGAEWHPLATHDIFKFQCFDPKLPNITVFATGGTIAGAAISGKDMSKYQIGSLGVEALIDAVPELCGIGNIRGVQVANIGSHNIDSDVLVHMAQEIQRDLDNPYTQGVVVTHGTDTLEETAFFLDLTVKSEKPIVAVGSMRPATAISADGPLNLLSSVALAASEGARNRGVMTAMNDRIGAARFMSKTNANRVDSFKAVEQGYLGVFDNTQPVFFYPPSRPLGHRHFDITESSTQAGLPKVDILYGHQGLEPRLFKSAVDLGARGVVLAGVGAGWWPTLAREHVDAIAARRGVTVMTSSRTMSGFVDDSSGGVGCGFLDPQKCRIQLQLCLETGLSTDEIRDVFQNTAQGEG